LGRAAALLLSDYIYGSRERTATLPHEASPDADEHMEELRIGLEQLARSYASQKAHMAQLRLGLERLAGSINSVGN
jgi:hypothetical protein